MKTPRLWLLSIALLALVITAAHHPAHAGLITGSVSLDTSALSGSFELAFIFTDGSGTDDANNTVTLSNFLFGVGGSAGTVDTALSTGGVSGDLTSGVSLVDSAFLNIFASSLTPGSLLSFNFGLTTNVDAGGTPDQLSLALLHSDGTVVNTEDPSGANSLLTVNIDSANPTINAFASDLTPAPVVTESAAVPEPPGPLLLAMGLGAALWSTRKMRAHRGFETPSLLLFSPRADLNRLQSNRTRSSVREASTGRGRSRGLLGTAGPGPNSSGSIANAAAARRRPG